LPGEAASWHETQLILDRFRQGTAEILELSRRHQNPQARVRMSATLGDYKELERDLVELLGFNRAGAADALVELDALQRGTERLQWGVRTAGLLLLIGCGVWGGRRIARYETDLSAYARDLEQRNRDLDAFAGRVAHDLKNALGPIVMTPAMLRQSSERPDKVLQIADRTERCSRKATAVIDALLAFSRAAQGTGSEESGALRPVVRNVVEELAPLAARLEASIEVEDIPDVHLRCSPGLLHIVLANLCGNAVKYLEGQTERRVRVSARGEGSSCRIEVEDSGPGIPKDALGKIFQPFFRVEGTRVPGAGIGLATVRRIVDARGGRIEVASVEGRGSRFIVWLPIAQAPEDRTPAPEPPSVDSVSR
jgi:signal transduction histidine kinase